MGRCTFCCGAEAANEPPGYFCWLFMDRSFREIDVMLDVGEVMVRTLLCMVLFLVFVPWVRMVITVHIIGDAHAQDTSRGRVMLMPISNQQSSSER